MCSRGVARNFLTLVDLEISGEVALCAESGGTSSHLLGDFFTHLSGMSIFGVLTLGGCWGCWAAWNPRGWICWDIFGF